MTPCEGNATFSVDNKLVQDFQTKEYLPLRLILKPRVWQIQSLYNTHNRNNVSKVASFEELVSKMK
jgi:hypothetical protein